MVRKGCGRADKRRSGWAGIFLFLCAGCFGALGANPAPASPSVLTTPSQKPSGTPDLGLAPAKKTGTVAPVPDTGFTVLCYHRFVEKPDTNQAPVTGTSTRKAVLYSLYNLPLEEFEWEMKYLKDHGITPISLEQLKAYWFDGKPLPAKAVLLTFDDGFRSIFEIAYPVLKRYHYPAVLFAYTDFIKWQKGSLRYDDIETMTKHQWTVESHTKSHMHMGKDEENYSPSDFEALLTKELSVPVSFIKDHFGYTSNVLAYPYGDYNDHLVDKTRAMGYQLAFGVCPGPNDRTVPPLKLHRNLILFPVKHPSFEEIFENQVLHLSEMFPGDGQVITDHKPKVSVKIMDSVVPASVDLGLDNRALSYTYDPVTRVLTHRGGQKMGSGGHSLTVTAEDAQGHKYVYSWFFRIKHYKKSVDVKEADLEAH